MLPCRSILLLALLAGCGSDYSADTYATRAVQQVNQVQQGVIVGAREVAISTDGSTGAAVGGAAGGIVGAATPGTNLGSALAGVGGGLIGGLFGSATERVVNDNRGTEYIVRKTNGELLNVTQRDVPPLPVGQKVLVIAGAQARIVPDYTAPEIAPQASGPAPSTRSAASVEAPAEAVPPPSSQRPDESPVRSELPPASAEPPPSPRAPLVAPAAPLAL
jgi:outer membrane lipoprotein SlyB